MGSRAADWGGEDNPVPEHPLRALSDLLLARFDKPQLVAFLGRRLAQAVAPAGPEHTTETWTQTVVDNLHNSGRLDDAFFARLAREDATHAREIQELHRRLKYGGAGPEPSPETTGAVILGARDFRAAGLVVVDAFANSAAAVEDYLRSPSGLGLPDANVFSLFDADEPAYTIAAKVETFLGEQRLKDLVVYFTGYASMSDGDVLLLLRSSRKDDLGTTSYPMTRLAQTLERAEEATRRLLLLDCAFPGSSSVVAQARAIQTPAIDVLRAAAWKFKKEGLAVVCGSSARRMAPAGSKQSSSAATPFSAGVHRVLTQGIASTSRERLTLEEVGLEVQRLTTSGGDGSTQVATTSTPKDDAGSDPFFPNPAFARERRAETERTHDSTFDGLLDRLPDSTLPSSAPIMIAIEQAEERLSADEIVRGEAHLTIELSPAGVDELARACTRLRDGGLSIDEVDDIGLRAWDALKRAQPRVEQLFARVHTARFPQPVAWAGRTELLLRIHLALLVARRGQPGGADDLLSVGYGDHYFHPLTAESKNWGLEKRVGKEVVVGRADAKKAVPACEVALIRNERAIDGVREVVAQMRPGESRRTRVALAFGELDTTPETLHEAIARLPCVSLARGDVWSEGLDGCLQSVLPARAARQAAPSAFADVRRAIIRTAREAGDAERYLAGATWNTWSWTGRPLFVEELGEKDGRLHRAIYPHLTDLRGLAQPAWNFKREEGIPPRYRAWALAEVRKPDASRAERFHLYLSGAGGTGKSCLLKDVYDQLEELPEALPVWYRVDAPGLPWDDVETRVKRAIAQAVRRKHAEHADAMLPSDRMELGPYLTRLADNIQSDEFKPLQEVVVIIDQLERTFESGDQPEFDLLSRTSAKVRALLKQVEDSAVRVFIASRKQYLPDFLGSYEEASETGLHFNILQKIEPNERGAFVQKIFEYCRETEKIIDEDFELRPEAVKQLTDSVKGHPLETVLALVYVFSEADRFVITEDYLKNTLKPKEHLFDFDIRLAGKDPLDRHFLLAMAHARAEIVGYDEVWWRLHLVDPTLTQRIEKLDQRGVVEWLWLKGHLGRTVLPREEKKGVPRFFEFFHANLRDHLLADVLSRAAYMPPAWRALDRLSAAAHEWDQTLKPLDSDDVAALMDHRVQVVEPPDRAEKERLPFYLLFMRDASNKRATLCDNAKECFVFSAVVTNDSGRWAFGTLYPNIDDRVALCKDWLERTVSLKHCERILHYLVAQDQAASRACLVELILDEGDSRGEPTWSQIARILGTPFWAARYRTELVVALLAREDAGPSERLELFPPRVRDFIVAACGVERYELTSVLLDCAERIETGVLAAPASLAEHLREVVVDDWLSESAGRVAQTQEATFTWEVRELELRPIELTVGSELESTVTEDAVTEWFGELARRLGVPLPAFAIQHDTEGEHAHELMLRIRGREIAAEDFYPPKRQVLARHWQRAQKGFTPPNAERNDNELLAETMLWLDQRDLQDVKWTLPMWTAEDAIVDWLEVAIRRSFRELLDDDLFDKFLRSLESRAIDVYGTTPGTVRDVLCAFVEESVPTGNHWPELIGEIRRALAATPPPSSDLLIGKLRVRLGNDISNHVADDYGQLSVILVHEDLQNRLMGRISDGALRLSAEDANHLGTDACLLLNDSVRQRDVMPVVACVPELRLPLRRMLEHFDPRLTVLAYTELSHDLRLVEAGMLFDRLEPAAADAGASDA